MSERRIGEAGRNVEEKNRLGRRPRVRLGGDGGLSQGWKRMGGSGEDEGEEYDRFLKDVSRAALVALRSGGREGKERRSTTTVEKKRPSWGGVRLAWSVRDDVRKRYWDSEGGEEGERVRIELILFRRPALLTFTTIQLLTGLAIASFVFLSFSIRVIYQPFTR